MKKILLILFVLPSVLFAQINYKKEAKKDFKKLNIITSQKYDVFKKSKDSLDTLSKDLSASLTKYYPKVLKNKNTLDSVINIANKSIDFYLLKGVHKDTINTIISFPKGYIPNKTKLDEESTKDETNTSEEEAKTYLLFGEEKIILKDSILKNPLANSILSNVFNTESETHFGTFWFPKDKAIIPVSLRKKKKITKKKKYLKFNKIDFELYEGSIRDIRVFLKDDKNNAYIFENRTPISLLRFNKVSALNYLPHTAQQTKNYLEEDDFVLRVSDVLRYAYGKEGNYVPNNVSFSFPLKQKNTKTKELEKTNKKVENYYELKQSTALNNVIDLRTYTDFLGLFNANQNGIAQIEGEAAFFVNTFNMANRSVFLFKKIKPYVSYTRFDENDQFIDIPANGMNPLEITNNLSILERAYFNTGLTLDLVSFKLKKEYPFETHLYFSSRYQVAKVNIQEEEDNYAALGFGVGLAFEFRRLKNFAFNYSIEADTYNTSQYNTISGLSNNDSFGVLRTEAEITYYPAKKKNNAIFLRLRAFDDLDSKGSSFFQAQFGYKFTLGTGKVKAQ